MKGPQQHQAQAKQKSTEPTLFGGYDPVTNALRLTVEASTVEEAKRRMLAVAPLVELVTVEHFNVLSIDTPSRTVPLFMEGFFQATRLAMKWASPARVSGIEPLI